MGEQPPSTPKSKRRKWAATALKAVVAAVILAVVIHKVGGRNVLDALRQFPPMVFLAAVGAYCLMQALKALRLKLLLHAAELSVAYLRVLAIYFIGMFFNTALPTIVGGDAVRVGYLFRETGHFERAAAATLTERAMGMGALVVIALAGLAFGAAELTHAVVWSVVWASGCVVAALLLFFAPWVYRLARKFTANLRLRKLHRMAVRLEEAMAFYRQRMSIVAVAVTISFIGQFMMIAIYFLVARGLGMEIEPEFFLIAAPVSVLISMVPITISGLGVREVCWVLLLATRGVSRADAVALSLLWFAVATASGLFGAPAFFLLGKPPRENP